MVSLLSHAILGLAVITWIVTSNRQVFSRISGGALFSPLEALYYVIGIASVILGWYFNIRFVQEYSQGSTDPLWGQHGSWAEYMRLMSTNPAASSASRSNWRARASLTTRLKFWAWRRSWAAPLARKKTVPITTWS